MRAQVRITAIQYLEQYLDQYLAQYPVSLGFQQHDRAKIVTHWQTQEILIKPCYPNYQAHYSCPVAFQLAHDLNQYLNRFNSPAIDQLPSTKEQSSNQSQPNRSPHLEIAPLNPEQIAQALSDRLQHLNHRLTISTISAPEIELLATSSQFYAVAAIGGHLNFRLSDRYLADCLSAYLSYFKNLNVNCDDAPSDQIDQRNKQNDLNAPVNRSIHSIDRARSLNKPNSAYPSQQSKFPGYTYVQYAYATCEAMLQLAQQEGLANASAADFNWSFLSHPEKSNQFNQFDRALQSPASPSRLIFQTEPELQLIVEILKIGDYFLSSNIPDGQPPPNVRQWQKAAYGLALSCLIFYEHCPMFGVSPAIAIARVGLFALTQQLIKLLVGNLIDLPTQL
ncbi:hypothetical protein [Thalassoporum mexicanum]|uniref:hypothetical protein n=1 Tax=Thalassoporum mexicanum TaxID=3457544 RepID=UPI0012E99A99|nr:hypothetical protein [Pseudanabaena sp. PCC 7367]